MDNRWLIASGFFIFAICSVWFGEINLAIGPWSLVWAIILSGFGSGMVFVPLSTTAMGTLPNEQIGNASGLYNLLRNIGGSIGISMVDTLIARHQQLHRAELARHLTPNYSGFSRALEQLHAMLATRSGDILGLRRAYGVR